MRYLTIFLVLFFVGCKSKKEYIYRDHVVDNTQISHTQETIFKGSKTTTIIPCKEVDQVVELGETKVELTTIPETNEIKVEISQKQDTITFTNKEITNKEITSERKKEIVYEKYIPKFIWYLLIASLLLNIWAYRKPILILIRKLLVKI